MRNHAETILMTSRLIYPVHPLISSIDTDALFLAAGRNVCTPTATCLRLPAFVALIRPNPKIVQACSQQI